MPRTKQKGKEAFVREIFMIRKRHKDAITKEAKKSGGELTRSAIVRQALEMRLFKKRRKADLPEEDGGKKG